MAVAKAIEEEIGWKWAVQEEQELAESFKTVKLKESGTWKLEMCEEFKTKVEIETVSTVKLLRHSYERHKL